MPTRREILTKARQAKVSQETREHYCVECDGSAAPKPPSGPSIPYDKDDSGIGINKEPDPMTARGAQNAPVLVKQPEQHRNFMRNEQTMGRGTIQEIIAKRKASP